MNNQYDLDRVRVLPGPLHFNENKALPVGGTITPCMGIQGFASGAVPPAQADQWDEATRGKKMSDAAGRVIFKYQMPVLERFTMRLPQGAEIIRVAHQPASVHAAPVTSQIWSAT